MLPRNTEAGDMCNGTRMMLLMSYNFHLKCFVSYYVRNVIQLYFGSLNDKTILY